MTQIDELDKILEKHQLEPGELTFALKEDLQNYIATQTQQAYDRGYADKAIRAEQSLIDQIQEAEKQGALNALTQLKVDYMNEWVGIDPKTMGLKTTPLTYQALIEDRIAQLRSTQ